MFRSLRALILKKLGVDGILMENATRDLRVKENHHYSKDDVYKGGSKARFAWGKLQPDG